MTWLIFSAVFEATVQGNQTISTMFHSFMCGLQKCTLPTFILMTGLWALTSHMFFHVRFIHFTSARKLHSHRSFKYVIMQELHKVTFSLLKQCFQSDVFTFFNVTLPVFGELYMPASAVDLQGLKEGGALFWYATPASWFLQPCSFISVSFLCKRTKRHFYWLF